MASALKCMKRDCPLRRVGNSNYCAIHRQGMTSGKVAAKKAPAKKAAAKKAPAKKAAAKKAPAKKAPAKKAAAKKAPSR